MLQAFRFGSPVEQLGGRGSMKDMEDPLLDIDDVFKIGMWLICPLHKDNFFSFLR